MIATGVRELRNNLGRYLRQVRNGEDVVITAHGKAVARIVQEPARAASYRERLAHLVAQGIVALPKRTMGKGVRTPPHVGGKPLSEMVIEDRR